MFNQAVNVGFAGFSDKQKLQRCNLVLETLKMSNNKTSNSYI
jgi:hypothetical protein